jgi:hypothetical protein
MNRTPSEMAGSMIRSHVQAPATPKHHAIQRARLVDEASRPPAIKRSMIALVLIPVAAVLALVVGLQFSGREAKSVSFRVGPQNTSGVVGEYVTRPESAETALNFSEGSRITLGPRARARVAQTSPRGVFFVLESGGARVDVVHRLETDWRVLAGPYTIAVKGTSFDVTWNAPIGTLEIAMSNGAVVVRGPGVESGVEVRDTQRFVSSVAPVAQPSAIPASSADSSSSEDQLPAQTPPSQARAASGMEAEPLVHPQPESSAQSVEAPAASQAPAVAQSWTTLASRGEYHTIVTEAEQRGVDNILGSASETELAALANAARYAARPDLAHKAMITIRSRFAGGAQAASAAFLLGRMAEDSGDIAGAIRWYDAYLGEAPGGSLAPEALGRRMVALRKAGQVDAARMAAEQYLARFGSGPYAGVAREIVSP